MSFIREKEISGNKYLYLVKNTRDGKKIKQKVLEYLGPKKSITERDKEKIKQKYQN